MCDCSMVGHWYIIPVDAPRYPMMSGRAKGAGSVYYAEENLDLEGGSSRIDANQMTEDDDDPSSLDLLLNSMLIVRS